MDLNVAHIMICDTYVIIFSENYFRKGAKYLLTRL